MQELIRTAINSGIPVSLLPFGNVGASTFNPHRLPTAPSQIVFWGDVL